MEVEAIGARPAQARQVQLTGVSAELAETRRQLKKAAPADRWDAVMDEVHHLQTLQGLSPLAALRAVQAKLAAGWSPPAR